MYDRDARIASEVSLVQREQVGDAVDVHRRNQASVMDLRSRNEAGKYKTPPFRIDAIIFRQQCEGSFDSLCALVSFNCGEAVTISVNRTRARIPEFNDVLRDIAEPFSASLECTDSATDHRKLWVVRLGQAQ